MANYEEKSKMAFLLPIRENLKSRQKAVNIRKIRGAGRPVKFPDSTGERILFNRYIKEGLSIRKIGTITGMSKDMVNIKLKRYNLK